MEIKILDERPNPLLKRTDYRFEIAHPDSATPTRDSVRAELAKATQASKDRVVIERMEAKFGAARSIGQASVYLSVDDAKAIAREHILVRNKIIEKAAPAAPGASADAAAAPAAPAEPAKGA